MEEFRRKKLVITKLKNWLSKKNYKLLPYSPQSAHYFSNEAVHLTSKGSLLPEQDKLLTNDEGGLAEPRGGDPCNGHTEDHDEREEQLNGWCILKNPRKLAWARIPPVSPYRHYRTLLDLVSKEYFLLIIRFNLVTIIHSVFRKNIAILQEFSVHKKQESNIYDYQEL